VLSAGVRPSRLKPQRKGALNEVSATLLTRLMEPGSTTPPIYRAQHLRLALDSQQWREANADSSVFMTYNTRIPLAAGQYEWKVIFRDDDSGKLGVFEGEVKVPDYGPAPALSTLLLTRQVVSRPKVGPPADAKRVGLQDNQFLDAGGLDFLPQPEQSYRQGDTIHLLFDIYNLKFQDTAALAGYLHSKLLRNDKPVENCRIDWQFFPAPGEGMIRVAGLLDTANLSPADYRVVETLPDDWPAGQRALSAKFTLLSK